jgi:hypothetical protein
VQEDPNQPFVPPPPPPQYGNSIYPPDVLAAQTKIVEKDARDALIMSIVGLFCLGFILGFLAFRKANSALQTIKTYGVGEEKRSMLMVAKVLGIIDIVAWAIGLVARFALS